jgi:hypothetical protein
METPCRDMPRICPHVPRSTVAIPAGSILTAAPAHRQNSQVRDCGQSPVRTTVSEYYLHASGSVLSVRDPPVDTLKPAIARPRFGRRFCGVTGDLRPALHLHWGRCEWSSVRT